MAARKSPLSPPKRQQLLKESRLALDLLGMTGPLLSAALNSRSDQEGKLVIVLPGFGSGDFYTAPLRYFLNRSGYRAEGWGLGVNRAGTNLPHVVDDLDDRWEKPPEPKNGFRGETGVPYLCDRVIERVEQRHQQTGHQIILIGWSLGGYLARETARDLPTIVDQVITMGSPVVGGPKYTAAAPWFIKRGLDLDYIEQQIEKRESRPITQPITAIVSKSDAIVSAGAAIDLYSENIEHVDVDAAHLGMGFNRKIWSLVIEALERNTALA